MKKRLFTPGPTPIPETVMLKMAEPIIHHRNPEFNENLTRVNKNLKYLFQTEQPVLTLTSSGTGGVESTFVSLFSPGDTIIASNGGKFGERWVKMPKAFGMNAVEIKVEWGKAPTEEQILAALKANPNAKAVYLVHSETSTGAATDVKALAKVIRENSNALVCVDGITAVGAHELRFDEWGIDVCVTGSQKGLMIPPGLAFVALSQRAIAATETSKMPRFYFDLKKALKSYQDNDTPWTPAVSLVIGVDAALQMIVTEGIENVWARHKRLANAIRAGVSAAGLKLFSEFPSYAVTPVWVPQGVEWKKFNKILKGKYGITIAGGQDDFKDKIFRISHLGYYDELDMITMIGALELTLKECGYNFDLGSGVKGLLQSLATN
ncbi:MAG: alanine--glyoxylate aminotransferase family protein [Ignavibacteriales bacterium]|nr:alanine--glyoxylate aminotransferase family protein [Ignavibacteriales bacterium]